MQPLERFSVQDMPHSGLGGVTAFMQAAFPHLRDSGHGRIGDCELDVGAAAVWLAGDGAAYTTGHTLMVDGGRSHL